MTAAPETDSDLLVEEQAGPQAGPNVVEIALPPWRSIVRRTTRTLLEATIVPTALFLVTYQVASPTVAVIVACSWAFALLGYRLVRRKQVSGLLMLSTLALSGRTITALASGSLFLYFCQPMMNTTMNAGIFAASAGRGTPIVARLVNDFCPIGSDILMGSGLARWWKSVTLVWALVHLTNAAATLWLLLSQSIPTFLVAKTVLSLALTGAGIAGTIIWFRFIAHRQNIKLRWRTRAVPAVGPQRSSTNSAEKLGEVTATG